jgi:type IV secretion system protein VirB4
MFVNELFVTIFAPSAAGQARLGRPGARVHWPVGPRRVHVALAAERRALDAARETVLASLSQYSPRTLKVYETPDGHRSEPLELLSCLFNGEIAPGRPTARRPRHACALAADQLRTGRGRAGPGRAARSRALVAWSSIKDYPGQTMPGMFDELYRLPFEMTVTQSFAFAERNEALGRMSLALRRMRSAEDAAVSLRDELVQAKDDVAAGRAAFGEHHTTIAVQADDLAAINGQVAEVIAMLGDLGINAVREDIALEPTFWSQFPGNFKYVARKGLVSSRNFAGFASLHNFPVGQARGNHWGDAVTLFETTAAGPYFFNLPPPRSRQLHRDRALGARARPWCSTSCSPRRASSGRGSSSSTRIAAPSCSSARSAGQYDRPSAPASRRVSIRCSCPNSPANRPVPDPQWLEATRGGLRGQRCEQGPDAIEGNYAQPVWAKRAGCAISPSLFRGHCPPALGRPLIRGFKPWWGTGRGAGCSTTSRTGRSHRDTVGFDMTAVLDDPKVRTPALFYFFHRVEERLDGTPSIIVVDEGWKALDDDVFVRRIKDWEKTIRKRNGVVGFATQSAQDALESRISSAIIEQAATQLFMINPKARAEDYINGFGLTPHEFDLVPHPARHLALLPDQARQGKRRRPPQPDRRAGPADDPVRPREHSAAVRQPGPRTDAADDWISACCSRRPDDGLPHVSTGAEFLVRTLAHIDCQAQTIGSFGFQSLAGRDRRRDRADRLLTLFIAIYGIRLLFGPGDEPRGLVTAVLKIGIVLTMAGSWPAWRVVAYDTVLYGPAESPRDHALDAAGAQANCPSGCKGSTRASPRSPSPGRAGSSKVRWTELAPRVPVGRAGRRGRIRLVAADLPCDDARLAGHAAGLPAGCCSRSRR